jgi:hypothetical protein
MPLSTVCSILHRRLNLYSVYSTMSRVEVWNAMLLGKEEKLMRKLMVGKIWIPAFLLVVAMAGCGDSDVGGGATSATTAPTVLSVTPVGAVLCPNTVVISATFSKAMNPATIISPAITFTLADQTGANVPGTVSLDSAGLVATFSPTNALAAQSPYTATISTAAADTFGNHLAANKVWTFTTPVPCVGAVTLGAACGYGILGGTTVTTTGPTHVTGDVGLSPGSSMTGWAIPPANTFVGTGTNTGGTGLVTGVIHITDPPPAAPNTAAAAQAALTVAYLDLSGRTAPAPATISGDLNGKTLAPGIWKSSSSLMIGVGGSVTLDGGGDPNAVWIFQISSALTTGSGSQVKLAGSASQHNIFWTVGSGATLGTTSIFYGSILSNTGAITLQTGATLNGRALQSTPGAVTLDSNTVTVPSCP